MSWPPIRIRPSSMSVIRSSRRSSVLLPPPDRPTRPSLVPLGTARSRPVNKRQRTRVGERHALEADVAGGRPQRLGRDRVDHGRRGQQQLGELRGLGQRALHGPVDLVELEHDLGRVGVVGEGHDDGLDAVPAPAESDGEHQTEHVGQHRHRRDQRVDAQVPVVPGQQRLPPLVGRRATGARRPPGPRPRRRGSCPCSSGCRRRARTRGRSPPRAGRPGADGGGSAARRRRW